MIAYLILHRDRGVPAQELIETFWSGTEGLNPMSTLQNNISRARNALEELGLEDGKRLIHNNSGTYFWAPDRRTVVDCEEFAKAAKEAQDCSDPAQSLEKALAAAKLYTADFLPESSNENWCMGLGPGYRQSYMTLCRRGAEGLMAAGRYAEVGALCEQVIRLEPMAEEFSCLYRVCSIWHIYLARFSGSASSLSSRNTRIWAGVPLRRISRKWRSTICRNTSRSHRKAPSGTMGQSWEEKGKE